MFIIRYILTKLDFIDLKIFWLVTTFFFYDTIPRYRATLNTYYDKSYISPKSYCRTTISYNHTTIVLQYNIFSLSN